jgi:hypothetical protein
MIRVLAGLGVMLAAVGLQFAMVIRLLPPSLGLALLGYVALLTGMLMALTGVLGRRGPG